MPGIFHIGYQKTGSTYLQKHFFPRSTSKEYAGAEIVSRITDPYANDFRAEPFREEMLARYGENFLMSSENLIGDPLSGACNGMAIRENAARMAAAFPDSIVVVFVREQVQMIQSIYAQYVKYGGTFSLDRLLNQSRNVAPFFCYEFYEYDRTIELLETAFERSKIFVYDYQDMRTDTLAFLRKLSEDLDLQVNDFSGLETRANVSMKKNTCRLLRRLNLLTARHVKIKNYWLDLPFADKMIGRIRVAADKYMPLNPPIRPDDFWAKGKREYVADRYRESNERLRDKFGIDLLKHVH